MHRGALSIFRYDYKIHQAAHTIFSAIKSLNTRDFLILTWYAFGMEENLSREAKQITLKNLAIVEEFKVSASDLVDGMLLSGSNAWGAFYAVTKQSDIDLVITTKNAEEIEKIIERYVVEGLLGQEERQRSKVFQMLFEQRKADTFSIRVPYDTSIVSIDFIPTDLVRDITELKLMKSVKVGDLNIRVINEFRSNPPKVDGYTADSLRGEKVMYHPKFEEIKNDGFVVGYISETLVDGQREKVEEIEYFIGVISFFFAVDPVILIDRGNRLSKAIEILRSKIAGLTHGQTPAYITRQERMSEESLQGIRKSFK